MFSQRAEDREGDLVVDTHNGGRAVSKSEHVVDDRLGLLEGRDRVDRVFDDASFGVQTGCAGRAAHPASALGALREVERPVDERDPPVPEIEEMTRAQLSATRMVDRDRAELLSGLRRSSRTTSVPRSRNASR